MNTAQPSVLIVDDHALVSTTLVIALSGKGITARRCDDGTPTAVLRAAAGLVPGVALVDMDLGTGPDGKPLWGVDLIAPLRMEGWRVFIMTGSASETDIAEAINAGAVGWHNKLAPFEELVQAVLDIIEGRPALAETERLRLVRLHHAEQARRRAQRAGFDQLTPRESEVLDCLVAGKRAAAIAAESHVSVATVRVQIRSILAKLGVNSQLEAVAMVRELKGS